MYPSRETHPIIGTMLLHPSKVAFLPCVEIPLMKNEMDSPQKYMLFLYIPICSFDIYFIN